MAHRFCGNCGHALGEDDRFCPNCGRAVHETARVPTPEADVPVPPPPQQAGSTAPPPQQAEAPTTQGGGGPRTLLLGCAGILVVAVLLGAVVSALAGGGREQASSPPERQEQDEGLEGGGRDPEANKPLQGERAEPQDAQQQQQQPPAQQAAQNKPKPPPEYTVGQTATVGSVEWTVTDAYLTNQLRSGFGTQKTGRFVVVDFTFTNNRPEEVTLDPDLHMILKDSRGREFGTDPDAWEFVPTRPDMFLQPVNPGLSQDGRVIYEVPPDAQVFVLILDDVEFWEDKSAHYDLGALPIHAYVRGGGF